jgi:hypothetical protein
MKAQFQGAGRVSQSAGEYKEGKVAEVIEDKTAKYLPSDLFLWTAIGTMAASLVFKVIGKNNISLFIGQWPAPILIMGLYNKLVKLQGHD